MGFGVASLDLCNKISSELEGKAVLTFGNPFISNEILRKSTTSKENKRKIISLDRDIRASVLFKEVYKAEKFNILDITNEEGADHIFDLNDPITEKSILNQYDFVIDLGTQEHVFNNNNFISNVFNLLKDKGNYIFELPANCCLEHGFRQYSPTFFYDLCYANKNSLSIEWLSISNQSYGLNMLPLYESLDKHSSQVINYNFKGLNSLASNHGALTGSSLRMFNNLSSQVSVLGIISKKESEELHFKVNQCLFRNLSVGKIIKKEKDINLKLENLKIIVKEGIVNFPMPTFIKFRLITLISKFIFNWSR